MSLIVLAILIGTLPSSLHRLLQSGDPYLFTRRFFEDILARLSGPGRLRFIFQPTVAILLGTRDGLRDARAGSPPFLWRLAIQGRERWQVLRGGFIAIRNLVAFAILLDLISQAIIFREVRPAAAVLVGPVLIAAPYVISRALANRIWRIMGRYRTPAM